jgi:putative ABC transport system ATP-binding protein
MNPVLVKTERLCKTFGSGAMETHALIDINLEIQRGEFVAVMGPSGCGKSTLMHILGLMLSPSSGKIMIQGHDTTALNDAGRARIRRDHIGFVFQRFNLLPTVSAYQNIVLAERIRGHAIDGQVDRALAAVQMTDKARSKPGQLSIGQQQRVAIARAISHQPDIIMADEPTGNLDSAAAEHVLNIFRTIHRQNGITVIMITHSLAAAQWADRIITMADGRIAHA